MKSSIGPAHLHPCKASPQRQSSYVRASIALKKGASLRVKTERQSWCCGGVGYPPLLSTYSTDLLFQPFL